jgi:hypothetical protein
MELSGTHQFLVYADDISVRGKNINTIKRNTEALLKASNKIGVDVNVEKIMYMFVSRDQNAGQNRNLITDNKSFESSKFKRLRTTIKFQYFIHEKLRRD